LSSIRPPRPSISGSTARQTSGGWLVSPEGQAAIANEREEPLEGDPRLLNRYDIILLMAGARDVHCDDWTAYGPRGEQKHCHRYYVGDTAYTICR
jgi:hypothetical protein